MNLSSRKATLNDCVLMTQLSNQLGYETTAAKLKNRLAEILDSPDDCVFVVLDNETIIGWIHGFYTRRVESDSFTEIGGMVVDEQYRRKGIGQKLINEVIEWALVKKTGKIRVRCNTMRKETHLFYAAIGFTGTKEQNIFDLRLLNT